MTKRTMVVRVESLEQRCLLSAAFAPASAVGMRINLDDETYATANFFGAAGGGYEMDLGRGGHYSVAQPGGQTITGSYTYARSDK